jgi:tripartite-type tricarboxylate transporter receptor subunit TctC
MTRHFFNCLSLIGFFLTPLYSVGQTYPNKPIKMIVPAPPGGTADIFARAISRNLQESLGKPVVVEYKSGAATNIGSAFVAKSAPDGYTILMNGLSVAINPVLMENMNYVPSKELTPIIEVAELLNVITVNLALPAHTLKELVQLGKKEPGKLNYGSPGVGSSSFLAAELLAVKTGAKFMHIAYQGFAPIVNDHLSGILQVGFVNLPVALQFVKGGELRALAVTSLKRTPLLPDVPTVAEALSIPDYELTGWFGLFAPARTPPEIILKLQEETNKALKDPNIIEVIKAAGGEVVGGSSLQFEQHMKRDTERLTEVLKLSGALIK